MKRSKIYAFFDAVKKVRTTLSDDIALENIAFFPDWEVGKALSVGDRIEYNGKLYKVITAHTTQETWAPDVALTLFEPIDIINEGTISNPIIAAVGMTYFKDKYYLDETDGKIYLCIRDDSNGNGTALYYTPSALVGTYFQLIN